MRRAELAGPGLVHHLASKHWVPSGGRREATASLQILSWRIVAPSGYHGSIRSQHADSVAKFGYIEQTVPLPNAIGHNQIGPLTNEFTAWGEELNSIVVAIRAVHLVAVSTV